MAVSFPREASTLPSNGPTYHLWADCPWDDLQRDPGKGYTFWDDYVRAIDTESAKVWTITQTTTGEISLVDMAGGGIKFDSAGNANAGDGINAQMLPEAWLPAAGKTIWMETRVKTVNLAADSIFVGLCDTETAIIDTNTLDVTGRSMAGFYVDTNTTAADVSFVAAKAGTSEKTVAVTGGTAIVADTFVKLGFKIYTAAGALRIKPYVDGVPYTEVTDTDDIPIVEMCASVVAQCSGTSTDAELVMDWLRIAQLR